MQRLVIGSLLGVLLSLPLAMAPARADQLITPAEAALPSPPDSGLTLRGITRGPAIEQVEPSADAKGVSSPVKLKVLFSARNNATIDTGSVKVTYIKTPAVDLSARLKPHITPDGIDLKDAEVPPGTHLIRIDLKDSQGRASTALIKLSVKDK